MNASVETPIICPVLVGRARELATLGRLITASSTGHGQIVLLAGEAGVGKSRLVAEARELAAVQGFATLQGRCFEADRNLPYAPLTDLLRTQLAVFPTIEQAAVLGSAAPALATLLPELAPHLPTPEPARAPDPEQARRRLFEALAGWLLARGPALIVLEDLHWSDDSTLAFFAWFARHVAPRPLLVILTYRSDDIGDSLRHTLAALDRMRLAVTEITLGHLASDGVQAMIGAIFAQRQPVRREFAEAIYTLTDGNPFFVEETLKTMVAAGEIYQERGVWTRKPLGELHIPRTVEDAVQSRVRTLGVEERRLLELAAVMGRRFDIDVLGEVAQQHEAQLLQLLKALIAAQLVVEESIDHFSFRHALTREAIYGALLARARRPLHRAIGEAIERRCADRPDTYAADLAYHFYEGGVWSKALSYARRAGERAQALFAWRAAVEQFTHAIQSADHLGAPASADLYLARGQAYELLGDFDSACADYEQAHAIAGAGQAAQTEWRCLLALGFLLTAHDYARAEGYLRRALDVAERLGDPVLLAHSLNRMGNVYTNTERQIEAVRMHTEALALFERLGDTRGQAASLDLLGSAYGMLGDMLAAAHNYARAIELFRRAGDRPGLVSCLAVYILCVSYYTRTSVAIAASYAELVRDAHEALGVAQQIDSPPHEAEVRVYFAYVLGAFGRFAEAIEWARRGLAIADEIENAFVQVLADLALGAIYLDVLAYEDARRHLESALAIAEPSSSLDQWLNVVGYLVATEAAAGETAHAADLLATCGSHLHAPPRSMVLRSLLAGQIELELALGRPAAALETVDRVLAAAPHAAMGNIPYLYRLRGTALTALGNLVEAEAALQAALAASEAAGTTPETWRIHLALGKLHRARRRFAAAEDSFAAARTIVDRLAAGLPDELLRKTFTLRAQALIPALTPTKRRAAKHAAGGLTAREREIARLVAQGRSNGEIAAALVLSRRTVEVHISNIMGKLGFTARTQVAAWAAGRDLAQDLTGAEDT